MQIQTNATSTKAGPPSSSPSSAIKRLPGSAQTQSSTPVTNGPTTNNIARPNRRLQRLSTRMSTSDNLIMEKKATWAPEPYGMRSSLLLVFDLVANSSQCRPRSTSSLNTKVGRLHSSCTYILPISDSISKMGALATNPRCAYSSNIYARRLYHMTCSKSSGKVT